ncbi:MAG: M12 family metallo-peptidase [Pyrinomonadaceae bacterium]
MKRNLKIVALLVITVLIGSVTLALTLVRAERSESGNIQHAIAALTDSAPAAMNQGGKTYRQDVDKVLKRHDSVELEPQRVAEQVRLTGRLSLSTAEGTLELNLAPYDMLAPDYRAQVTLDGGEVRSIERGPVRTYKGTVAGIKGAQARFTIDEDTLEGLIITPTGLIFVEPGKRYSTLASSKDFLVYNSADVIDTNFGECGVTLAGKVGAEAARVKSLVPTSQAHDVETDELFSPPRVVDLATEADFEYFTFFGSNAVSARNEIISIVNQVEGIYNTQFGLRFSIVFQNVWATSNDPYTTTDSDDALDQFKAEWDANRVSVARDLAHMWTGRSFDGSTIGIAYRPGMDCPLGPFSYGMSERLSSSPGKFLLTAHEIGHNFNATHTNNPDAQPPTQEPGCENTIMQTSLGSSTLQQFCPFSVTQIENHANSKVACLSQATTQGCTYSVSPTSQAFGVNGGSGSTNLTTSGFSCAWGVTSSVGWITINSAGSGVNSATISFTVAPNSVGFARSGIVRIADQSFTVTQAGSSACPITPISYGQTINASLSSSDCFSSQQSATRADQYSFSGAAGDQIKIEMNSTANPVLDTYLFLIGPNGALLTQNDDIDFGVVLNSRIPVSGFFTLPATGLYVIESTAFDSDDNQNELGTYTLTLTTNNPTPTPTPTPTPVPVFNLSGRVVDGGGNGVSGISVSAAGPGIPPNNLPHPAVITNSNGDFQFTGLLGGATYTVTPNHPNFTFNPVSQVTQMNSHVSGVTFVATRRTINLQGRVIEGSTGLAGVTVWLIHQVTQQAISTVTAADGTYQFNGALLNDVYEVIPFRDGYRFNPPSLILSASQSNLGDITATLGNPIDGSTFFVTKQYEDFFGRQPDAPGLAFWVNGINGCDPFAACRQVKRIDTSAAFFLSIEFQETGYLVYRLYKAGYGDLPSAPFPVRRAAFIPDTRTIGSGVVVGQAGWEQVLENNKQAFLLAFVQRPEFQSLYPAGMSADAFVTRLDTNAGTVLASTEKANLVATLSADSTSAAARAAVVRAVAENSNLNQREFNKAFVLMQYFGYLQRNPDDAPDTNLDGYNFWLTKLNQFNGDFRQADMVKAFITSSEYRSRFGPP